MIADIINIYMCAGFIVGLCFMCRGVGAVIGLRFLAKRNADVTLQLPRVQSYVFIFIFSFVRFPVSALIS